MNFKKFLAMFLSLAMVLGSMGTVSFAADATDAVAMIGDVYYSSIDEAVNSAADGDTITVLSDCTLSEEITVDKSLKFEGEKVTVGSYNGDGNPVECFMTIVDGVSISGDNLSGAIAIESGATVYVNAPDVAFKALGDTTFKGDCVAYSFSASNSTINIGADATLKITKASRLAMGHGNTYNITGNVSNAKETDLSQIKPSLSTNYGASFSAGADSEFNITNAFVLFGYNTESGSYTSSSKWNTAKMTFNIVNSIFKTQGKIQFANCDDDNAEFEFNCKDSVIKTTTGAGYIEFSEPNCNVVFDNTDVNADQRQYLENYGTMTIKNGSRVLATIAKSSHGHNAGTLIVDNASYDASGDFTVPDTIPTPGKLIVKNGGVANISTITKNAVEVSEGGSITTTKITDADVEVSSGGSLTATTISNTDIEIDAASEIKSDKIEGNSTVTVDYSNVGAGASISIGSLGTDVEVKSSGEIPSNVDVKYEENGVLQITVYVAEVDGTKYTDLTSAFKAVKANSVINLLQSVTITEDWNNRNVGAEFKVPVTIDGNNNTIKFTGAMTEPNRQSAFRFEDGAIVKNLTIDMTEATTKGPVMRALNLMKGNLVVDNCTFLGNPNVSNTRAIIIGEGAGDKYPEVTATITNSHFSNWKFGVTDNETGKGDPKSIVVTGSTFTNGGAQLSATDAVTFSGNTMDNAWVSVTSYSKSDVLKVTASGNTLEENTATKKNTIYAGAEVDVQEGFTVPAAVASLNGVYYSSLNKALAVASDGAVITLLDDVTIDDATEFNRAVTLNLNSHTLDMTAELSVFGSEVRGTAYYINAPVVIENGTVNVSNSVKAAQDNGVFFVEVGKSLTFNDVEFNSEGFVAYAMFEPLGDLTFNNSTIDIDGKEGSERFAYSEEYLADLILNDTDATIDGLSNYATEYIPVIVSNGSNVVISGNGVGLYKADDLKVDATSVVDAKVYVQPQADGSNIAGEVAIEFVPTDDQHVYNIYAVALDGTINRLSTAQLKFDVVASDADIAYSLTPDENVALTADLYEEDAYIFNLDGVHESGRTGAKIKLGQVAFDGVGSFEFKVVPYSTTNDKGTDVQLTAATINDNIVKKYTVGGTVSENTGIFNVDASTTGVIEIVEAERQLTVNVDFNNNIKNGNSADYNDFTITVACANGEVQTGKIGSGSEADVVYDDDYTVDSAALDFTVKAGYRYTITIEGAGYRTYRHTTLIGEGEDAFVVNFWNNALADANGKPVMADVEKGKPQKDITFLAGDIVKDNSINIYDLSAVVSYFGEGNFDLTKYSQYARYDLNRDGYIDSTDVAYVLVAWDK